MENQQAVVLGAIAVLGLTGPLVLARPLGNWRDHVMAQSPTPSSPTAMMHHSMPVSSEFDYLAQMIPHHQEAIATAQIILERSRRPEMQAFARQIIAVQRAEIEQMQGWLKTWYPDRHASVTYEPMMRDLSQLEGDALDQTFLQDMIGHHREAVMMSQMLLNHHLVQHPPVQSFAQNIATAQRQEIDQMQAWLLAWFGDRPPMGRRHHGS